MPSRPPHPCAQAGCGALVQDGPRCQKHKGKRWKDQRKHRDPAANRFYASKRWRWFRKMFLADHPMCVGRLGDRRCRAQATEVHHKIPRREAPQLALDPMNCEALCKSCHSRETAREVLNKVTGSAEVDMEALEGVARALGYRLVPDDIYWTGEGCHMPSMNRCAWCGAEEGSPEAKEQCSERLGEVLVLEEVRG